MCLCGSEAIDTCSWSRKSAGKRDSSSPPETLELRRHRRCLAKTDRCASGRACASRYRNVAFRRKAALVSRSRLTSAVNAETQQQRGQQVLAHLLRTGLKKEVPHWLMSLARDGFINIFNSSGNDMYYLCLK